VYLKILKKDLKRKKSMNAILFIFMILASMLIAGSVNMLYTTSTAIEHFKNISNVPDFLFLTYANEGSDLDIKNWVEESKIVNKIDSDDMLPLSKEDIIIPKEYGTYDEATLIMLEAVPTQYNLIYNQNDELLKLKDGEIAIPYGLKEASGLEIGETMSIMKEGVSKEFTVAYYLKDVTLGSDMMGIKRIIINENDYAKYIKTKETVSIKLWSVMKNEGYSDIEVAKSFGTASIANLVNFDNSTITATYIMDILIAGIMIIVSIFLILISFLVLRFTIVFTVQEDYKEIGVMKAIGIKNKGIRRIYIIKYLSISLIGGVIGFFLSFLYTNIMMQRISKRIIMQTTYISYILAVGSVAFIIVITMMFCMMCSRKINKMSAIDAIRQGGTGERFSASRKLKLSKRHLMSTQTYLALSDLISGFKRFIILMITFLFGTVLIIVPINVINTLSSGEILQVMGLPKFDVSIYSNEIFTRALDSNEKEFIKYIDEIEQDISVIGVNVDLHGEAGWMINIYAGEVANNISVMCFKAFNYSTEKGTYLKGMAPKLPNEIAISTIVAQNLDVTIGDTISCSIQGKNNEFIVTALFQSMNNMGKSIRLSEAYEMTLEGCSGISVLGLFTDSKSNIKSNIQLLKEAFPELDIKSSTEYASDTLGNVTDQIDGMRNLILLIVLGINFLITCLLVKMLVTKEKPEIAMLKSIGFKNRDIRKWQVIRIAIILVVSIILGVILANTTGSLLTSGIFRFMGATQMKLIIEPMQVYVIYPIIILAVTLSAVFVTLILVRKIQVWDINNQE